MRKFFQGFTMIELLIVIAIIGVLATIFVASYPNAAKRARDARRQSDIRQYQVAVEKYANKNNGFFPTSGGATVNAISLCATLSLTGCPEDPNQTAAHLLYKYYSNGGTDYAVWAHLEAPSDSTKQHYVVCSSGKVGFYDTGWPPPTSGSACPL